MSFSADFQSPNGSVLHIKRVFSFTPEGDCTNSLTIDGKTTNSYLSVPVPEYQHKSHPEKAKNRFQYPKGLAAQNACLHSAEMEEVTGGAERLSGG